MLTWDQIVLLVTKAVGDFLGTTGIADEAIRFNGYPFLDKDDHAYNIPGTLLCIPLTMLINATPVSVSSHAHRITYFTSLGAYSPRHRYVSYAISLELTLIVLQRKYCSLVQSKDTL